MGASPLFEFLRREGHHAESGNLGDGAAFVAVEAQGGLEGRERQLVDPEGAGEGGFSDTGRPVLRAPG